VFGRRIVSASIRPLIHLSRYCSSDSEDVPKTTKAANPKQGQKKKEKKEKSAEERDRTEIRSKCVIPETTDRKKEGRKTHVPLNEACKPANEVAAP
jgi:hypothetical protein